MDVLFRVKFQGEGKLASKREPVFITALGVTCPSCYNHAWFNSVDGSMVRINTGKNPGEVYNNTVWYKLDDESCSLQEAKELYQAKAIEAFIAYKNLEIQKLEDRKKNLKRDILYLSGLK